MSDGYSCVLLLAPPCTVRDLLVAMLQANGFTVKATEDVATARRFALEEIPDLVVIHFPEGWDSPELRDLLASETLQAIPRLDTSGLFAGAPERKLGPPRSLEEARDRVSRVVAEIIQMIPPPIEPGE